MTLAVLTWASRCTTTSLPLLLHLFLLLTLSILRYLRQKLQQCEQELALFRPQVITQLLQLLHVLLDLLSLLIASKLKLVNALQHMGLSLLSRFELTDKE